MGDDGSLLGLANTASAFPSQRIRFTSEPECWGDKYTLVAAEYLPETGVPDWGKCTWVIRDTPGNMAAAKESPPPLDSRVFLVSGGGGEDWSVKEVFAVSAGGTMVVQRVDKEHLLPIWERRDLQGLRLVVGYVSDGSWLNVPHPPEEEEELNGASGPQVELFRVLMKRMNFTMELVAAPDRQYGVFSPGENGTEGSWNGLVGQVVIFLFSVVLQMFQFVSRQLQMSRREIDLTMNFIGVGSERASVVDYGIPGTDDPLVLWIKEPRASAGFSSASSLLFMLRPGVWLVTAAGGVASFALFVAIKRFASPAGSQEGGALALTVLGLLFGQGASWTARLLATRVLFLTCLLFGIMFMTVFSARLAATISVRSEARRIAGLPDLAAGTGGGGYKIYVLHNSFYSSALSRIDRGLWDRAMSEEEFHPLLGADLAKAFFRQEKVLLDIIGEQEGKHFTAYVGNC